MLIGLCVPWITVHPVASFPPTVLLPGVALPPGSFLPFPIGQGSFGLGSPVSSTMTTLRLLIVLPARFFSYLTVLAGSLLFRVASHLLDALPLFPQSRKQPGSFVFRFVRLRYSGPNPIW